MKIFIYAENLKIEADIKQKEELLKEVKNLDEQIKVRLRITTSILKGILLGNRNNDQEQLESIKLNEIALQNANKEFINLLPQNELKGEDLNYNSYKGIKISQRKDNRYQARVPLNGTRKSIYGNTRKECYEKLKVFLSTNKIKIERKITFYEYWDFWYKNYKEPFMKENTLKNYRSVFKNQIKPNFEDKDIKKVSALDLNLLLKKLPNCRMKEYASQYLAEVFKQAYKDRKIPFDFWEDIRKYHHKREEGTALTIEQRKILIEKTKEIKHGKIFLFYLYTGARPGEGLAITPNDIEENFIHIPGTKTDGSDRYIPKFTQVKELLKDVDLSHKTIFNISEVTLKRERKALCKLCGFDFLTKDLRTTFATMCAEKGIAPRIIAKWLGHTTTNTTNKYYIKVLDSYEKEQIKLIDTNFDSTKSD